MPKLQGYKKRFYLLFLIITVMGTFFISPAWSFNLDLGIYREAIGLQDEDDQVLHDETFDTIKHEDGPEFTQDSGDAFVTLESGGHYFLWYTLHFHANNSNNNSRTENISNIRIDGTDLETGYGQGYTRAAGNEKNAYLSGGAIINVSAGSTVQVMARNSSATTNQDLVRRANMNGMVLTKLDDEWDYLRIHESTGGTDYNNVAYTDFSWDTIDEYDTGSFTYVTGEATIGLKSTGHYLLTYSNRLNTGTSNVRIQMNSRVTLAGTVVEHCYSGTYIRGNPNGNSTNDGAIAGTCIINNTIADQELVVQLARTGLGSTVTSDVADQSGLTIVKLPDDADYIRIHESTGGQSVDASNDPITWDTNDEIDASFSHSIVSATSDVTINTAGHYLFTACLYADRAAVNSRYPYIQQWRVNDITTDYGSFGSYNRGDQASTDAYDSANCGAIILDDMSANDVLDLTVTNEGGATTGPPLLQADQMGLTGVYLNSLFLTVDGTSDLAASTTISCAIDGTRQSETATTAANGSWSMLVGKPISTGSVFTCWADGVSAASKTTSIMKYDGSGDISGLVLKKHILTLGSTDNQSFTLSDFSSYDYSDDPDILHSISGNTFTVDASLTLADASLNILSGESLTISSSQTLITHDLDNDGTLTMSGSGGIVASGSWVNDVAATFTPSTSKVLLSGTGVSEIITTNGDSFNDLYINDSLIGYWDFEETVSPATDYSGYEHNATWQSGAGSSTSFPTVNFSNKRSITLNGSSDFLLAPTALSNYVNDNITLSAWVYTATGSGQYEMIMGETDQGDSNVKFSIGIGIPTSNSKMCAGFNNGAWQAVCDTSDFPLSAWTHVAASYDGHYIRVYVNGTEVATSADLSLSLPSSSGEDWRIGRSHDGTAYWDGEIDDLRLYNRVLSGGEITLLANGNTPSTGTGTYTMQDSLDVNGDLWIHSGTLSSNTSNITLAGTWNNTGGDFTESSNSVILNGANQGIGFSETFYNLTKSVSSAYTLTISKDSTITIGGTLTLSGTAGNLLSLRSSTSGASYEFKIPSDQSASYLNVQDSHATDFDIIATYSTNNGGNDDGDVSPYWIFSSTFYWVGSTNPANTNLAGSWAAASGACGTGGAGVPGSTDIATFDSGCTNDSTVDLNLTVASLSIESSYTGTITPNSGIAIDVNGVYSQADGTLDFNTNNTSLNVSGNFTKTGGAFSTGTGSTTFDGSLTVNVDNATNLGNIIISNSPNVTVTLASDATIDSLTVATGDTFVLDGYDITTTNDVDVDGILNATNGTDGNTSIKVGGNWDLTNGTFTNTNSTIEFNSTTSKTIKSDTKNFDNITFNGSGGSWILQDNLITDGDLNIDVGTLDVNVSGGYSISAGGDWDNNATFLERSGTVTISGSSTQNIAHGGADFYNLAITNTSDVVTFSEEFTTISFTNTAAGSSLKFQQSSTFTVSGTLTWDGVDGNLITVDSVNGSSPFGLNVTAGNQTITYAAVSNSDAASNNITASSSSNNGGNDDLDPTPHWIFLSGESDYLQPDIGAPGMNLVVNIIGDNFTQNSIIGTDSSDIIIGSKIVVNSQGSSVATGGKAIVTSLFLLPTASEATVTVTVDGVDVANKFYIKNVTTGDGDFTGDTGTIYLGDGNADHGDRTQAGTILLDELIIPAGLTVYIDTTTDSDPTTDGNQGYLPAVILVNGDVSIEGTLEANGSNGSNNVGDAGGDGGDGAAGAGGGGGSGGDDAAQGVGGTGYTGGGGGSCETDSGSCSPAAGGAGSGASGGSPVGGGGIGGAALTTSLSGGGGAIGDTTDGAGGGGGTGYALGSSGGGGSDPATDGAGNKGGGGGAFDGAGGGGGFGSAGTNGTGSTGGQTSGNAQLIPYQGGSGGGAGGGITAGGGGGGGGGGGAITIYASGTMDITGSINVNGGDGGNGNNGGGGAGSGGAIVLRAWDVATSGSMSATGGTGGTGSTAGGTGGAGRIRVDGVPAGGTTILGTILGSPTEFVGPVVTSIGTNSITGTAAISATIEIDITDGNSTTSYAGSSDANGDFTITVDFLRNNYITVVQETGGGDIRVMNTYYYYKRLLILF